MRRDGGSPPTRLTTAEGLQAAGTTAGGFTPVWSPDGRKIVFSNNKLSDGTETTPALFTMRADGSRQKPVRLGFDAHHPDWQPVPKDARAEDDD